MNRPPQEDKNWSRYTSHELLSIVLFFQKILKYYHFSEFILIPGLHDKGENVTSMTSLRGIDILPSILIPEFSKCSFSHILFVKRANPT